MTRALTASVVAALVCVVPFTAFAGNDDQVLIGTQGGRLAGAVTASVTDASALWYNPGAIGRTEWAKFGLNGSLVQLRITRASKLLAADSGPAAGATLFETDTLPSTMAHEIPLANGWALSYGAFASQGSNETLRTSLTGLTDAELRELHIALTSTRTLYHVGGGIGIPLGHGLRIGIALFGVYESERDSLQFAAGSNDVNAGSLMLLSTTARSGAAGQLNLGVQWSPTPAWDLGATLIAPRMLFFTTRDELESSTFVNIDGSAEHSVAEDSGVKTPLALSAPLRVRAGVAHHTGNVSLMLDADFQTALHNDELFIARRFTPNVRVAFDYRIDEGASLGAGLFTDLAADSRAAQRINFYGLSAGLETTTRYQLASSEPAAAIELSSFIGVRYAFGYGKDINAGLQLHDASAGLPFSALATDIYVHELGLNLGGGLRF